MALSLTIKTSILKYCFGNVNCDVADGKQHRRNITCVVKCQPNIICMVINEKDNYNDAYIESNKNLEFAPK